MKRNSKHFTVYLSILSPLLLAAVVLRTIACFKELDYSSGYFGDELLITISEYLTAAAILIATSYAFIGEKRTPAPVSFGAASYIPAGAVSAALLFLATELMRDLKNQLPSATLTPAAILEIIAAPLALLTIFCFFFDTFYEKRENQKKAYFGMAAALFFAAFAVYLYFDTALPINAPNKITEQMAFLFAALYFIYETRISLGRSLWRAYTTFGLIAAIVTAYASLPALILYFARGELISNSTASALLTFLVFIFIAVRVLCTEHTVSDEKCPAARAISNMAQKRNEQIRGEFATAREDNNVENDSETVENYSIQIPDTAESEVPDEQTDTDA